MATFKIKKDSQDNYYWILMSDKNQKIIAKSSESYESKIGVKDSMAWVKLNANGASTEDEAK